MNSRYEYSKKKKETRHITSQGICPRMAVCCGMELVNFINISVAAISYDCPSAHEVILAYTGKLDRWKTKTDHMAIVKQGTTNQCINYLVRTLPWRHNGHHGVSYHQPHDCLLNRLFRRRSKKISKPRVTGPCVGNSPGPINSPHKWPVTRKMFPFDDVIMTLCYAAPNNTFLLRSI